VRQCVLAGYLYATSEGASRPSYLIAPADLPQAFEEQLAPAMEALLAPLEAQATPPGLAEALAVYQQVYAIYAGTLGVSLRRARAALAHLMRMNDLDPRLAQDLLAGTPTETTERDQALWQGDLEYFCRRWGALAPRWDVACPTFGERPPAV